MSEELLSKKTETLELIKSKILSGLVDETILDCIEAMEELGESAAETMIAAYRAVAMECTAAILVGGGGDPGAKYAKAVDRIWRRRIGALEKRDGDCKLVTGELRKCREKMELSLRDPGVCAEICGSNTRNLALLLLQAFLKQEQHTSLPHSLKNLLLQLDNFAEISTKPQPSPNEKIVEEALSETPKEAPKTVLLEKVDHTSNLDNGIEISPKPQPSPNFLQVDEKIAIPENIAQTPNQKKEEQPRQSVQSPDVKKPGQTSTCENDLDASIEPKTGNRRRLSTPNSKRKSDNQLILARRKSKRWTPREEEVLRNEVKRFGNSWKFILTMHSCEFEGRTEVDLKDKWRNMNKYSTDA